MFPEDGPTSEGLDASGDGAVVVGWSDNADFNIEAYRWTAGGGMVGLGFLSASVQNSEARGVSADGSVVTGYSNNDDGPEAFMWTAAGGMVGLGVLPGGSDNSQGYDVSADGSTIVGYSHSPSGFQAFRWTAADGMVGLGDLPGGPFFSEAYGVSADGSVIVGKGDATSGGPSNPGTAFVWTSALGMLSIKDALLASGETEVADWQLSAALAVSADGTTIVGSGTNAAGSSEAWMVTMTAEVPEPATWILGLLGVGALAIARHFGRRGRAHPTSR
jgi:probable HAF family extracellular repeat protein